MQRLNIVGPQVRRLRYERSWSQNTLATKLQLLGWDIDRAGVGKIESQLIHVDDHKLLYLARVFQVGLADLFPSIDPARPIYEVLSRLMRRRTAVETSIQSGW